MPVDLYRAGDVADVVEQNVLVRFDDGQAFGAEMPGEPIGGHQAFGVGVVLQRGAGICG